MTLANVEMPVTVLSGCAAAGLGVPLVLAVEWMILERRLRVSTWTAMVSVLAANAVSATFGVVALNLAVLPTGAVLARWLGSDEGTLVALAVVYFVAMWAASAVIEGWILRLVVPRMHERSRGRMEPEAYEALASCAVRVSWRVNTASYLLVGALWASFLLLEAYNSPGHGFRR